MIRYALKCPEGHEFDSWFQNADAYEALRAGGHVSCPTCGATEITKSLMAPRVRPARKAAVVPTEETPVAAPRNEAEEKLAELKAKIEAEADYVGMSFATEARAMHEGDAPERPIYGEASGKEALELLEDGIPVLPLPFTPTRKTN